MTAEELRQNIKKTESEITELEAKLTCARGHLEGYKRRLQDLEPAAGLSPEQLCKKLVGMHTDKAFDELLKADLKWKIVGMNGKRFPTQDEGKVEKRVLVELQEEMVESAKLG